MNRLSLTTKMSLMVSLLVALVLSFMTLCASWYLEKQFMTTISAQQSTLVKTMAQEIDAKLRTTQLQLVALADTVTPDILQSPERAQRFLDMHRDVLAVFDSGFFLFSPQGKLLAMNPLERQLIGGDYAFRDYYKQAVRTGKPVISEPMLSTQQHRHPTITFAVPIFDAHGRLIGVLAGMNDLLKDNYLGKLASAKLGEKGYFYLFNQQRTIIVHPDRSRILQQDVPVGKNKLFDRAIAGFEGTGETVNSRGLETLSSFVRVKSTGWILAANFPRSEAYAPLQRAKLYLLAALIVALCGTVSMGLLFMRHLTAPLVTFIRHVERITGKEKEPEPIRIETGDEIGTLALAFNRMMHEVHRQKEAARQQREFSENLLQNSSIATYVLDRQHRVIIWNKACEELTGMPASEVCGTDQAWKAFYSGKRPVLADLVIDPSLGNTGTLYRSWTPSLLVTDGLCAEGWFPALKGRERFLCFDAAPIRNAQGEIVAAIESLRDITEHKQDEESLRKLSLAIDQTPVTVMITDREGIIEYVNPNFSKVTGYLAEEAIGKNPNQLVKSGWHSKEFFGDVWRTILSGKEWRGEMRNKRKNGELYWESASISPVKGPSGEISHFVAVKEDITERKKAEEALSRSDEKIRLLLESTAEAIFGIDLLGNCTFVNPSCARLLGYDSPDQLLGRNMHELIHHSRPDGTPYPVHACPVCRVLWGEEGVHHDDETFWRADGTFFAVEYWSYPQLHKGELVGGVVTFFDITERKRAEEELRRASDAANAATKAKSQFLANMSHEIRTPMNAALGMLYLLQQTELSEQQKNYLAKAQTASTVLLRVINDILDFSKIEAGKLELEKIPFSLSSVLADLHAVATATLQGKPIELQVRSNPQVPNLLVGDPVRLGQVLLNLASNALKFTEKGKVEIEVHLVAEQEGEVTLRFCVTDTGIGMAQPQLAALFSAFSQADTSTTRRYGGTGLGLAISKQLVELMGGEISVASELGQGSTFSFTGRFLRSAEQATSAAPGNRPAAEGGSPLRENFSGVRVLLVEDNPINQEVAKLILERSGVAVDVAENGAQAVHMVTESGSTYHAVFMDVHMPVMDGLEATRRIRLDPAQDKLPIIAMTASALSRERKLCLDVGMNDQVNKPIDVEQLFATLSRWVGPQGAGSSELIEEEAAWAEQGGLPRHLPGIDLKRAMRIVESAPLLRRLLIAFGTENSGSLDDLHQALADGDRQRARRIVHTVKGVGGNLGASELCSCAVALELAMQGEDEEALSLAQVQFRDRLAEVLGTVQLLGQVEDDPELDAGCSAALLVAPDTLERFVALAAELRLLLETHDLSALGVWEEMRPLLCGEEAARLQDTLQSLDFSDACRILLGITQELEVSP